MNFVGCDALELSGNVEEMRTVPKRTVATALLAAAALAACHNGTVPKINGFTAAPSVTSAGGGSVTLSWDVTGADSLSIDQGVGPVTPVTIGSKAVLVGAPTTFTLTATNETGNSVATATVTLPIPQINSFTAAPSVTSAGGGPVTLSWDVTGAASLSIDQGVGPVTPVTIGSKAVLVGATTMFTLTATDDTGNNIATATVTVPMAPPTQTVTGKVVDIGGQPVAGETVLISAASFSQTAVTDSQGAFTILNVPTPYDATVFDSAEAVQYQGLTRSDPSLTAFLFLSNNRSATLSGSFVGGSFPEAPGFKTQFIFASPQVIQSMGDFVSGSYSKVLSWPGPTSTTGTLYALQIHSTAGLPANYPGYGTLSGVTLQDNGTLAGQNVNLSAVTPGSISGTVTVPTGYTLFSKSMALEVTSGITLNLLDDTTAGTTFSYVSPNIASTTLLVSAAATSAAGEFSAVLKAGQSANGSGIALAIAAAPTLSSPANAMTGVTVATPFSWTEFTGGVYEFQASSNSTGPAFYIITAARTVTLPDLASVGLPLPASTEYGWSVVALAPVSSIDVLAAAGGINRLTLDLSEGVSAQQTFTTAP